MKYLFFKYLFRSDEKAQHQTTTIIIIIDMYFDSLIDYDMFLCGRRIDILF